MSNQLYELASECMQIAEQLLFQDKPEQAQEYIKDAAIITEMLIVVPPLRHQPSRYRQKVLEEIKGRVEAHE